MSVHTTSTAIVNKRKQRIRETESECTHEMPGLRKHWLLLVFLIVFSAHCSLLVHSSPDDILSTVGSQPHSRNDLREWWPQLLLYKEGYYHALKIDPHWRPYDSFCQLVYGDSADKRGCFPLSHDSPTADGVHYWQLNDVLSLLNDTAVADWLRQRVEPLRISLCFKVDGFDVCGTSESASNWLSLIDDFFSRAQALISSFDRKLEFILDGEGTNGAHRTCLANRWRPWNSTFISTGDPQEAFYSNDVSHGWDRLAVLDDPQAIPLWFLDAVRGFGKFRNGTYPFLLWEPEDEASIKSYVDLYVDAGYAHKPGFLFAINQDPVQLALYSGANSWRAVHKGERETVWSVLATVVHTPEESHVLVFSRELSIPSIQVATYFVDGRIAPVLQGKNVELPFSETAFSLRDEFDIESVPKLSSAQVNSSTYVVLSSLKCWVDLWTVTQHSNRTITVMRATDASVWMCSDIGSVDATVAVIDPASAPSFPRVRVIQVYSLDYAVNVREGEVSAYERKSFLPRSETAVLRTASPSEHRIHAVDAAVVDNVVMIVASDAGHAVSAAVIDLSSHGYAESPPLQQFSTGDFPSVSGADVNGEAVWTIVHTNGFCFNSATHNKEPKPMMCDLDPYTFGVNNSRVLVYSSGSTTQWQMALKNVSTTAASISSCNAFVSHGAFDQGRGRPSTAALLRSDGIAGAASPWIFTAALGLHEADEDVCHCGLPIARPGDAVLNGWRMPVRLP